ncbi:MAG: hypothetical protein ACPKOI_03530 [Pleomorphochaeta sp.]
MEQNLGGTITIIITPLVTIAGFFFTYFLNKRNYKEEISKQKQNINLDKSADLPYKIQYVYDEITSNKSKSHAQKEKEQKLFKELMSLIFAYGSMDAIKIITNLQEFSYSEKEDNTDLIAYYILLLCQTKYDLTGIEVNPQFWYRMKLTDYKKTREKLNLSTNSIINKLELSKFLIIR